MAQDSYSSYIQKRVNSRLNTGKRVKRSRVPEKRTDTFAKRPSSLALVQVSFPRQLANITLPLLDCSQQLPSNDVQVHHFT